MANISTLEKTLGNLLIENGFKLDDRTSESLLNRLFDYASLIPFDANGNNWSDFFSMGNNSASTLAELFDNPEKADGNLLPQQAFLLAFLQLMKTPRALLNSFPARHRDLYYRRLLGLQEWGAEPDSVTLGFTLSNGVDSHFLPVGTRFDGGKDASGTSLQYALDDNLFVNRGSWSDLRWVQPDAGDSAGKRQLAASPYGQSLIEWPRTGRYLFDPATTQQAVVTGRMIASALLAMSSGERTITLTFASNVDSSQISVAQVSASDAWLDLTLPATATTGATLVLTLADSAPAVCAPDGLDGITATAPYLKIGRTDGGDLPAITGLTVQATGSGDAYYSTDDGVNRLDNVSYPLGVAPLLGNGFNLMMPQWCGQSVALTVTLTPQWIGLPDEGFPDWYSGYDSPPKDNSDYKLQPLLMSASGSQALSSDGTNTAPQPIFKAGIDVPLPATLTIVLPPDLQSSDDLANNPCDWPQWLRLELAAGDFGYQDYQALAGTTATPLNPPYTPQMKSLTMSYSATDGNFSQYLLTPFGYMEEDAPQDDRSLAFLYLGFSGSRQGDTLSLYWQMQSPKALVSDWQYLNAENQWSSLAPSLTDGTKGLLESGLWSVTLPQDISSDAAWMPADRCWIRAVMDSATGKLDDDTPGYVWLQDVIANGMTATLVGAQRVDDNHFRRPLAAGSITRPVVPVNGLATVSQPYPSWGGRAKETPAEFYTRSAARLFHRNRALAWQDMGAILKAQYANVWDVVFPTVDALTQLPAPQTPVLLVIPVNEKKDNQDPLRPAFSQSRLYDMASYLQALASPWCQVRLTNPRYRDVAIAYDVSFNVNPDYGYRQLQERLTLRYMPWIVEKQRGVTLGNTLDYYGIIAWIQQLPFVTQVNGMTLDGQTVSVQGTSDEVLVLSGFTTTSVSSAKETV